MKCYMHGSALSNGRQTRGKSDLNRMVRSWNRPDPPVFLLLTSCVSCERASPPASAIVSVLALTPATRVRAQNTQPINHAGQFVLYWMTATRRTRYNFGLQHAAELAAQLGKPLLVVEALRCDYPDACDRFHQFVIDGMRDNARSLKPTRALYYP